MLFSVMINYSSGTSPITYKYANHGKIVPTRKYSKFNYIIAPPSILPMLYSKVSTRYYSTSPKDIPESFYDRNSRF